MGSDFERPRKGYKHFQSDSPLVSITSIISVECTVSEISLHPLNIMCVFILLKFIKFPTLYTHLHHEARADFQYRARCSVLLCTFPFVCRFIQLIIVTILSALATHFGGWVTLHTWHNLPEIHFLVFDVYT
jgi:hypothetical protein